MEGWKDEKMKGWEDERMKGWVGERMKGWKDERMRRWKDENGERSRIKEWKDEMMTRWKDERMKGWKDERIKGWKDDWTKEYLIVYSEVLKLGKRWLLVRSEQDLFTETVSGTSLARATTPKYQSPVLFWIWSTPINQSTHSTNKSNIKGIMNVFQEEPVSL